MAQRGKQTPQVPGMVSGGQKRDGSRKGGAGKPGSSKARTGSRQSVAAARRSKGDRTQLIIGGVAIAVIIAIIAVGLVLYQKNTATQGSGYGVSKASTATVDDSGVITVSNGNPSLQLDVYEDALCPICAEFEHQFGQQIAKAIDDGQLTVHYRMVDFLNGHSASGNYSTRAFAALQAVAKNDGGEPGVFMAFHTALYDAANQPKEGGTSDLSDAQLASLAGSVGASKQTQDEISSGSGVDPASSDAASNLTSLNAIAAKAGVSAGTPTVVHDGTPVATNNVAWLTNLLPQDAATTAQSSG